MRSWRSLTISNARIGQLRIFEAKKKNPRICDRRTTRRCTKGNKMTAYLLVVEVAELCIIIIPLLLSVIRRRILFLFSFNLLLILSRRSCECVCTSCAPQSSSFFVFVTIFFFVRIVSEISLFSVSLSLSLTLSRRLSFVSPSKNVSNARTPNTCMSVWFLFYSIRWLFHCGGRRCVAQHFVYGVSNCVCICGRSFSRWLCGMLNLMINPTTTISNANNSSRLSSHRRSTAIVLPSGIQRIRKKMVGRVILKQK